MRLWFDRSSDVTLHEQIVTELRLAILAGELAPGTRLPSVRELARRFSLHSNTVSTAYVELQRLALVERRRGSGVYVRTPHATSGSPQQPSHADPIDALLREAVRAADRLSLPRDQLTKRLTTLLQEPPRRDLLLIEPDPGLARIVIFELESRLGRSVTVDSTPLADWQHGSARPLREGMLPLVLPSKAELVRTHLEDATSLRVLRINSTAAQLEQHLPAYRTALLAVVSGWPQFLSLARTMLVATGYSADALLLRDTHHAGWQAGLDAADAVVCDAATAVRVRHRRVVPFRLLSPETVDELRNVQR